MKSRLVNQFLLSVYIKSAGMLPDKPLGKVIMYGEERINEVQLSKLPGFQTELIVDLMLRFCRSGRPRKMSTQTEKLTIVLQDDNPTVSGDECILEK